MTEVPTEEELLRRAGTGDREAFDAFLVATAPSVWTLLRRLTADDITAEDAMQETFVATWRGAHAFRGEGSARSWLYGLARRQAARTWRRRAGEPRETEQLSPLAAAASWGNNPEVLAARSEDRQTLLHGISTLSATDQEVLIRCDLQGESSKEVASALGIAPGALRVRLHRARLRLLGALSPEEYHG